MDVEHPDADPGHLHPEFRRKILVVLTETADHTGSAWRIVEGYRSVERQLHLYAQGRTRPGNIVTWKKTPTWHGAGVAADVVPEKHGYQAPRDWWEMLLHVGMAHGLDNPAWHKGDLGHLQLSDRAILAKATAWVKRGFRD